MHQSHFVYILTNKRNGTLYIGMTNNIVRRVYEHKNKLIKGFTKSYGLTKLIYYEKFNWVHDGIKREKQLKTWRRVWKLDLIEKTNPKWIDLSSEFSGIEK